MENEIISNFVNIVKNNYAYFDGRARRKEYWYFVLVNIVISIILGIIGAILGAIIPVLGNIISVISIIISLALLIPSIAVAVRRLHDISKSGWFLLIGFIPFVGIYLIYLLATEGVKETNEYGSDPKANENKY